MKQQERFEAWAKDAFPKVNLRTTLHVREGRQVEVYVTDRVQRSWEAWQEAERQAEHEELRRDAERLDFMMHEQCTIAVIRKKDRTLYRVEWPLLNEAQMHLFTSPRKAIDAAIASRKEPR